MEDFRSTFRPVDEFANDPAEKIRMVSCLYNLSFKTC